MDSKVLPPKNVFDRALLTDRIEAASESFCFGERKVLALVLMLFVVKLLVIAGTGGTAEVGDSTRGSLVEEVTGLSFDVPTVNEELLPRFGRVLEGCGEATVAKRLWDALLLPELSRPPNCVSALRLPVDLAFRRNVSLVWAIGVSSPSSWGEGGCAERGGVASEDVLFLKSRELLSVLSSGRREMEGEGGMTVTLRLEPPSEGKSSGLPSVRSRAGVTRICAGADFLCPDEFREWLCRGEVVSLEDAFELFPGLVSFAKKLGAISFSRSSAFPYSSLPVRNETVPGIA